MYTYTCKKLTSTLCGSFYIAVGGAASALRIDIYIYVYIYIYIYIYTYIYICTHT